MPNIHSNFFHYVTKELSMDAILSWLLDKKDENSKIILSSMININKDDIKEISNVIKQKKSIDVFVEFKTKNDELCALIIEDKVDTFIHGNQMFEYINKVLNENKYIKIYYVLFKIGFVYPWEKDIFEKYKSIINNNEELDDFFLLKDIPINGNRINNKYDFSNNINICDIYTLEKWKECIKNFTEIKDSVLGEYKAFLDEKIVSKNEKYEEIYGEIKNYFSSENNYTYRFSKPSGAGKRDYNCYIYKEDFIKYSEPENCTKINDNFFILPYIEITENGLIYKINISLIVNKDNSHGYKAWNDTKRVFNEQFIKKHIEFKKRIITNYRENPNKIKDNILCVYSQTNSDFGQGIKALLDTALNICDSINNDE